MAKIYGNNLAAALGDITVYRLNGQYCLRSKSSLTRKRVLKDKAFEKTRRYAGEFAKASGIGSLVYRQLPLNKRRRSLYRQITGKAASLLYQRWEEKEVQEELEREYLGKKQGV